MKPHIKAFLSTVGFFAALGLLGWGAGEGITWLAQHVTFKQVVLAFVGTFIGIVCTAYIFIMYQVFLLYWSD